MVGILTLSFSHFFYYFIRKKHAFSKICFYRGAVLYYCTKGEVMATYPGLRKCLIVGIILSFLVTCLVPVAGNEPENDPSMQSVIINLDTAIDHLIMGYLPPFIPKNPHPENNTVDVPINTVLRWTGGDPDGADLVTYDVYLGIGLPIQKVASNISMTSYNPGILEDYLTYMWRIVAWDNLSLSTKGPVWHFTTSDTTNHPPIKPNQPTGVANGNRGYQYTYSTITIDPDGPQTLYYLWDWGDGNYSGWLGPYDSGVTCEAKHAWNGTGNYSIKVKAKDIHDFESDWSDPFPITIPYSYNKLSIQVLDFLFQRCPNTFPLLRQILRY